MKAFERAARNGIDKQNVRDWKKVLVGFAIWELRRGDDEKDKGRDFGIREAFWWDRLRSQRIFIFACS